MANPNKDMVYRYIPEGSLWKIYDEEDFTDNLITLIHIETGEDFGVEKKEFKKYFQPA